MRVTPLDYAGPRKAERETGLYVTRGFLAPVAINIAVGLACLGLVYWAGGFFKFLVGLFVGAVAFVQCFVALMIAVRAMEKSSGPWPWRLLAPAGMLVGVLVTAFASWSGITRADWCC